MSDFYNFIADENEMKFFFKYVLEDISKTPFLSYLMCIAVRPKKLTPEEREYYKISGSDGEMMREEITSPRRQKAFSNGETVPIWNYEQWASSVYKYECNKRGFLTKSGIPYPEKALVVMHYVEPSNEVKVANYVIGYANQVNKELADAAENAVLYGAKEGIKDQLSKLTRITRISKSCHAQNCEKRYIQIDFDMLKENRENEKAVKEAQAVIWKEAINCFGKGNFFIIRTRGGWHVIVKRNSLANAVSKMGKKGDPIAFYISQVEEYYSYTFEEAKKMEQNFVPLPGTLQYGDFIVRIVNKTDFEEE